MPDPFAGIRPGDRVSFAVGDRIYTDTVASIHYESVVPATAAPRMSRWQRLRRRLTPRRYRRALPPVGGQLGTVTVTTTRQPDG